MNRTIATATLGLGLAAQTIENAACEGHRVLRNTATLGSQTAFRELMAIWALCRKPGWDGNDAVPVEQATLNATFCLLDS